MTWRPCSSQWTEQQLEMKNKELNSRYAAVSAAQNAWCTGHSGQHHKISVQTSWDPNYLNMMILKCEKLIYKKLQLEKCIKREAQPATNVSGNARYRLPHISLHLLRDTIEQKFVRRHRTHTRHKQIHNHMHAPTQTLLTLQGYVEITRVNSSTYLSNASYNKENQRGAKTPYSIHITYLQASNHNRCTTIACYTYPARLL